jgi:HTH-type transcriptional regulator/antitoxin HigA
MTNGHSRSGGNVIQVINTQEEYHEALAKLERLMDLDPAPDSAHGKDLALLSLVIGDYESRTFKVTPPDPVDALLFRMEQQGLIQRDLVPYIGSPSKVSEVLSRKRPLSKSMIRKLHEGLKIPLDVLLQATELDDDEEPEFDWKRFPLKEMIKRGWIPTPVGPKQAKEILLQFLEPLGSDGMQATLYRRATHIRATKAMNEYALRAWAARVVRRALENPPLVEYKPGLINLQFMQQVARLSSDENAPVLACNYLWEHGISVVIEPHLPQTHLDGALLATRTQRPVIGLSLRYDRLDNFWYTLMHELAHISLHFDDGGIIEFFDDLGVDRELKVQDDPRERQADELAGEALIPSGEWERSAAIRLRAPAAAEQLGKKLHIHPAIVAGRMRYHFKAYQLLNELIGHGEVRRLFPEVSWEG